ncbi:MAG: hypothetical protein ACHP8A_04470 [Terriglobales bacterium]
MRKQSVDALGSLLRLKRIDAVFGFVALFADGQDAEGSDSFERVAGLRVQHAHANECKVADVDECSR